MSLIQAILSYQNYVFNDGINHCSYSPHLSKKIYVSSEQVKVLVLWVNKLANSTQERSQKFRSKVFFVDSK